MTEEERIEFLSREIEAAKLMASQARMEAGAAVAVAHAAEGRAIAADDRATQLERDLFGGVRHGDRGVLGRIEDSVVSQGSDNLEHIAGVEERLKSQGTQNKWILGILVMIVLGILAFSVTVVEIVSHPPG